MKSKITTHILDTTKGKPAKGIPVSLFIRKNDGSWTLLSKKETNTDGRIEDFMESEYKPGKGIYRLDFETQNYFSTDNIENFYPLISVLFEIKEADRHYHIPLLLNPFGYTTYRGS